MVAYNAVCCIMAWLKHFAISIVVSFLARESFIKNQPLSPPKIVFFKKVVVVQPWFFGWWSLVLVCCLLPIYYIVSPVSMWGVYICVNFPVNVAAFPYPACVQERMTPNVRKTEHRNMTIEKKNLCIFDSLGCGVRTKICLNRNRNRCGNNEVHQALFY